VALKQEIRELLSQWRKYLQESDTIFVHAPSANKKIIYSYEDAPLDINDKRIQSFPFTTHRPTLNEIKRAFFELTDLKVVEFDESTLRQHEQELALAEEAKKLALTKLEQLSLSMPPSEPEAEAEQAKPDADVEKAILLTKQGKVQVLESFIERCRQQGKELPLSGPLPANTKIEDSRRLATLLHVASSHGQAEVANYLLRECGADPTAMNEAGKVPYDLCKDKLVRNVFRRCMCDMPGKWDWLQAAKVPSPLTAEMERQQLEKEEQRQRKEQETRQKLEEQRRQREERKLASEPVPDASGKSSGKSGPLQALYGGTAMNTASMSPEARRRLERELRLRAAEARRG
jgi:Bacteroidetes VLRF1 release factor